MTTDAPSDQPRRDVHDKQAQAEALDAAWRRAVTVVDCPALFVSWLFGRPGLNERVWTICWIEPPRRTPPKDPTP